jgi:hypothetical protein
MPSDVHMALPDFVMQMEPSIGILVSGSSVRDVRPQVLMYSASPWAKKMARRPTVRGIAENISRSTWVYALKSEWWIAALWERFLAVDGKRVDGDHRKGWQASLYSIIPL